MSREDIRKLIGGYASDTLSNSERRALLEAALENQELFDALAKEQGLRDVLQDETARQQLLEALGPAREYSPRRRWLWLPKPAALAAAGGMAGLLIVAAVVLERANLPSPEKPVLVAQAPAPAAEMANVPVKVFAPAEKRKAKKATRLPQPPAIRQHADLQAARQPVPAQADAAAGSAPAPQGFVIGGNAPTAQDSEEIRKLSESASAGLQSKAQKAAESRFVRSDSVAPVQASNLAVRYTPVRRAPDGKYVPIRLGEAFQVGDAVRLRLEPNDGGYIYLFQRDPAGGLRLVASGHIERGQASNLPARGALKCDEPGTKQLLLVFSRRPQPELADLATPELDALASQARSHILHTAVSNEERTYAVSAGAQTANQKVAVEITLEVR